MINNDVKRMTTIELATQSSGVRWVERYFLPLINQYVGRSFTRELVCLQVEPDDEEEAQRLRAEGFVCNTVVSSEYRACTDQWQQPPMVADPSRLPFESEHCDLIFSGAFSRIACAPQQRVSIANEFARVCRKGGALLLTLGNRRCPVDLSQGRLRLHSPWRRDMVTLAEMHRLFVDESGFSRMRLLSLAGHFGWQSLTGMKKSLGPVLDRYLRWSTAPDRPRRYASPLNPLFSLWIER